jgi:hypothetical protein
VVGHVVEEGGGRLGEEGGTAEPTVLFGEDNLIEETDGGLSGPSDLAFVDEFVECCSVRS